jgi:hypothetical protein
LVQAALLSFIGSDLRKVVVWIDQLSTKPEVENLLALSL